MFGQPYIKSNFLSNFCPDQTFSSNFNCEDRLPSTQVSPSPLPSYPGTETSESLRPPVSLKKFNCIKIHRPKNQAQKPLLFLNNPSSLESSEASSNPKLHLFNTKPKKLRFNSFEVNRYDTLQVDEYTENVEVHTPEFNARKIINLDFQASKPKHTPKSCSVSHNTKKRSQLSTIEKSNMGSPKIENSLNLPKIFRNHFRFDSHQRPKRVQDRFSLNSSVEISSSYNSPSCKLDNEGSKDHFKILRKLENFLKQSSKPQKYYKDQPKIKHEFKIPKEIFMVK